MNLGRKGHDLKCLTNAVFGFLPEDDSMRARVVGRPAVPRVRVPLTTDPQLILEAFTGDAAVVIRSSVCASRYP